MNRDRLIEAGVVDASDVYDIPTVCDGTPPVGYSELPKLAGWWLLADKTFIGPFASRADAQEFADGCSPDDPINPIVPNELMFLEAVAHSTTTQEEQ